MDTIPLTDSDYKIKWADFKKVFKEQFVPEVAVSVVRNEWRALKFNKNQVLKFNVTLGRPVNVGVTVISN